MKKIVSFMLFYCAFIMPQAIADDSSVERIAAPLQTLMKQFTHNPNTEAEVILRSTKIVIDENYFSHSTSYIAVYINSDEAVRDYSQISISFNSFYEDIALEFAHVRTPDGQLDSIKADATQIQSPTDENFYQDRKELLFSLPNVRKGSIIEFQYRHTDIKKIIPGQWFDSFSLHWWEDRAAGQGSRADPVALSELNITAPKQIPLFSNNISSFGITQTRHKKGEQQILNWKGKNLSKIVLQESMPREHARAAHVRVSSIKTWQHIAEWGNQLIAPHLISDTHLDKLINEIAKNALTPDEKIKAVYKTLQEKVRYVFAHVGRGGYEPHNAFEVLSNGYGDCKDQTALAVTILRRLGIKADPALVITRSRGIPDMNITNVNFDHMIVHIPTQLGVAETWLDTSGDKSLFPGFSLGLEAQPALIINPETQTTIIIPALKTEQHYVHFDLTFDKFENKNTEANFIMTVGGMFEQRLRGIWQLSPERDKNFREMMGHIFSSAEVISLKGNNADNLWQGFNISGRFAYKNVWNGGQDKLIYGFNITQLMNLFADVRNLYKPQDRLQDYVNDPGYVISTRVQFTQPSPTHVATLTGQGQNFDNPYFSLSQTGHEDKGNFILEQTLTLKPFRVIPQDYPTFYALIQQLLNANDWSVVYNYNKAATELAALTQSAASSGNAASFIALARLQIKNGAYDKALEAAYKAVLSEPKNGETYYVLGLAQGYTNSLYDSEKSFAKAEELGFSI